MPHCIATYQRTTANGAHWYSASIEGMPSDVLEYFQDRAMREPNYTIITEDEVRWSTQFLCEDKYALSTGISKSGNIFLKTDAILSASDRRQAMLDRKNAKPAVANKSAVSSIDTDL